MSMDEWIKLKPGDKINWIGLGEHPRIFEVVGCKNKWHPYPDYYIFNPNGIQCVAYSRENWALISKAKEPMDD